MPKFMVQAVQRQGYDGSWRAGRKWPSSAPVEVEVVDQDDDPQNDPAKGIQLGQKSWKQVREDRTLRVLPAGDPLAIAKMAEDAPTLRAEIDRLAAENAQLRSENQRLQKSSSRRHEGA